ncbi:hypothetical protein RUND412_011516, partial [Rhizina undulata]
KLKKKKDEKKDKPKGEAKRDSGPGKSYPKSNECYAKAKASSVRIAAMKERWELGRPGKDDPKKKKSNLKAKVSIIQASSSHKTKFNSNVELDTEMLGNFQANVVI